MCYGCPRNLNFKFHSSTIQYSSLSYFGIWSHFMGYAHFWWCQPIGKNSKRFLRFTKFLLKISSEKYNYRSIARQLGISSSVDRRRDSKLNVFSQMLSGSIDFPKLVSLIIFKVHHSLKSTFRHSDTLNELMSSVIFITNVIIVCTN